MTLFQDYNHVSMIKSWLHWEKMVEKYPERLNGYIFPQPIEEWYAAMGAPCAICDGDSLQVVDLGEGPETIYCLCEVLLSLKESKETLFNYESPIQPAYMKDIVPLGLDPVYDNGLLDAKDYIEEWFGALNTWIVIIGTNGVGKTHIMRAIKTRLQSMCAFISVDRFQQSLFFAKNKDDKVDELITFLSTVPILLLDDWGIEHNSSWTTNTLASIINSRYNFAASLPTVISTNISQVNLITTTDYARKRIVSRIFDSKISATITLNGSDYRSESVQNSIADMEKQKAVKKVKVQTRDDIARRYGK